MPLLPFRPISDLKRSDHTIDVYKWRKVQSAAPAWFAIAERRQSAYFPHFELGSALGFDFNNKVQHSFSCWQVRFQTTCQVPNVNINSPGAELDGFKR